MHVADRLGDFAALPEIAVGRGPFAAVGVDHPQVVIGDGTAVLVAGAVVGLERAAVVHQRFFVAALDRRENAEVLLDAGAEGGAAGAELERAAEGVARQLDVPRLEIEAREGVQGLGGENVVPRAAGDVVTATACVTGQGGFAAMVIHDPQSPQRLRPRAMAGDARQAPRSGPAPIAVHDDRDVQP